MKCSADEIRSQIQDAESALKRLDIEMEGIQFDPLIPASVSSACTRVDQVIEKLLTKFKANPILGPLTAELKIQYIEGIQLKVANAKVGSD